MGLDMFLTGKLSLRSYNENHKEIAENIEKTISKGFGSSTPYVLPNRLEFEVAYWRKANAIHKWFVDHVQEGRDDCNEYWVSFEQLKELQDTCIQVLEDKSKASSLLPTHSGFFFGSTEYDDYYFTDVDDTIELLDEIISNPEKYKDFRFFYSSSW